MISKKIEELLNQQINAEFQSAYTYLAAAAYCASNGLPGAAQWFMLQTAEEDGHGMKILNHLLEREGQVRLTSLPQPKGSYGSLEEVFQESLKQERKISEMLNAISIASLEENDHTTHHFMDWFLVEQVEEIDSCNKVLDKLKLAGNDGAALLMIDRELGMRQPEKEA